MSTYVFVELEVARGKMEAFCEAMSVIIPAVEKQGWRYIWGAEEKIGQLCKVYNIAEVADANVIQEVPVKMASELEKNPALVSAYDTIAKVVIREKMSICDRLPYWNG